MFGVDFVLAQRVTKVEMRGTDRIVHTTDGSAVAARAVVLAIGVAWRRRMSPRWRYWSGPASSTEPPGRGPGSAGPGCRGRWRRQLRRPGRCPSRPPRAVGHHAGERWRARGHQSKYLITEITSNTAISVRVRTEILDGGGSGGLETLTVVDHATGHRTTIPAAALFVLIGAEPHTEWLAGTVARDAQGYLRTGQHAAANDADPAWRSIGCRCCSRTGVPGVFAAGDVRSRSIKRVAAAVGEGATSVRLIHAYLAGEDA